MPCTEKASWQQNKTVISVHKTEVSPKMTSVNLKQEHKTDEPDCQYPLYKKHYTLQECHFMRKQGRKPAVLDSLNLHHIW